MIKYIMTTECPRKCKYCISRNIPEHEETLNDNDVVKLFRAFVATGETDIMLTGGEPTVAKKFFRKIRWAADVFPRVHITTQNREWLENSPNDTNILESITFSRHGETLLPDVRGLKPKVYLSIMEWEYSKGVLADASKNGFDGVSIQENNFGSDGFEYEDEAIAFGDDLHLSVRVNRAGHCLDSGTKFIMPDLTVKTSFEEYL